MCFGRAGLPELMLAKTAAEHNVVFVGDLRLSAFKSVLSSHGIQVRLLAREALEACLKGGL